MKPVSTHNISILAHGAGELCYHALSYFVGDHGSWGTSAPRGLPVREKLNLSYHVADVSYCVPWLETRRLNYSFMAAEFLWMWLGRRDVASISKYCKEIARFSDDGETFFGAYGPKIADARAYVVDTLRRDPDSRQAVFTIWRPNPGATKDVPCTVAAQFLVRNGALHGIFTMRSSDVWLGLPYDTFNFCRITAAIAELVGEHPGSMTINVGSAHLYERNLEAARRVVDHERYQNLPGSYLPATASERDLNEELDGAHWNWLNPEPKITGWTEIVSALRYRRHGDPELVFGGLGQAVRLDSAEERVA